MLGAQHLGAGGGGGPRAYMSSRIREDLILKSENLRVELRPEWSDFRLGRAIMSPHRL